MDVRFQGNNGHDADVARCLLMTHSGLSGSAQGREALATLASDGDNLARRACKSLTQGPHARYWHAELGADGKDYRANFVHAPFFRKFSAVECP